MAPRILIGLLLAFASTGCASLISGPNQKVRIRTHPDSTLTVDGREYAADDGGLQLSRGRTHTVRVARDGYESKNVTVSSRMNGWVWGNLALGPFFPIGMLVDAVSGAINSLSPDATEVELVPSPHEAPRRLVHTKAPETPEAREPEHDANVDDSPRGRMLRDFDGMSDEMDALATREPRRPPISRAPQPQIPEPVEPRATIRPRPSARSEPESEPERRRTKSVAPDWIVAVMEMQQLRGHMSEDDITMALTDQMRVFLGEHGVRVLDRGAQEGVFTSQLMEEKRRSYDDCVDSSCQIPLGRALAASHLLRTSIARFGTTCTANGELIDIRSEATVAAASVRGGCREEALLESTHSLASAIVSKLEARWVDDHPDEAVALLRPKVKDEPEPFRRLGKNRLSYSELAKPIAEASETSGLPIALIDAVIRTESGYRPKAVSRAGAQGLMQLMPKTADSLGVDDAFDPIENIRAGTRYLRQMYDLFESFELAVAAYNAGPHRIRQYDGIPPFKETQAYVRAVMRRYREGLERGLD